MARLRQSHHPECPLWPLQNLIPFRPGFHTEGKEDEEAALLPPLWALGMGKTLATTFRPLQAPSSLNAQYLTFLPVLGLVLATENILQPPSVSSIISGPLAGPQLNTGSVPASSTDLACALSPNKGTLSSAVICVLCLRLCVD